MNLLKLSTLSALFLILVGCSSIPVQTHSTLPPALLQPLPPIPHLYQSLPGKTTMGDLYRHDQDLMQLYSACAIQVRELQAVGAVAPAPQPNSWLHNILGL